MKRVGGVALAKAAGVQPHVIEDVFAAIVRLTRKDIRVSVRGFGAFFSDIHRGRVQITPMFGGDAVEYGDRLVMKFKASKALKQRMNRPRKETKKHGTKGR